MFRSGFDHLTGILTCLNERLREEDCDHRFVIHLRCADNSELHIGELTAQHRHHTTDQLRIAFSGQTHDLGISEIFCRSNDLVTEMLYLLRHELLDLFLELGVLINRPMHGSRQIRCVVQHCFQTIDHILSGIVEFICASSGNRLYTTHSCSYAGLHDNTNRTDSTGTRHVATTTELNRRTVLDHTHVIAVFLAEQSHRSHCFRLSDRGMTTLLEVQVLTDDRIGQTLYLTQLFRAHFLEVREVKTQALRRNQTTLLLHVLAEYLTQCVVDNMRSRVIAHDRLTTLCIHLSDNF